MLVYIYQAALYCKACGEALRADITAEGKAPAADSDYESDEYPCGPTEEGESDTPSHCDACGVFLETTLTSEGKAYVIAAVRAARAVGAEGRVSLTTWAPYYDLDYGDTCPNFEAGVRSCDCDYCVEHREELGQ